MELIIADLEIHQFEPVVEVVEQNYHHSFSFLYLARRVLLF